MLLYAGGRWRDIDSFGNDAPQLIKRTKELLTPRITELTDSQLLDLAEDFQTIVIACAEMHVAVAWAGDDLDRTWLDGNWQPLAECLGAAVSRIGAESDPEKAMSALAHEMRTPLTSIKGYAMSILRQDVQWTAEELNDFAQLINDEADTLVRMVSEVLETSATRTGNVSVELEPILIGKIVTATAHDFSARDPYHRYICSIPDDLPPVMGDPMRLRQVLSNLLDNAAKYAVEGSIVVSAQETSTEVVVSVADEGPGLRPEHLNRLFERFFRVRENGSRSIAGTGLGLPLARELIERQQGRIWATSSAGRGTTVSFSVPKVVA